MSQCHLPAVPAHAKSKSLHLLGRQRSFHLPRRHDDGVDPRQDSDLDASASAYLSQWINDVSGVYAKRNAAHDDGATTMNKCHVPAVLPHAKSKSFHLPRRRDDGDVIPRQDLNASASAYLSKWINDVSGVHDESSGNDDAAHDDGVLVVSSPNLRPPNPSSPGTYPTKQSSTRRVVPLPMTGHSQLKGRDNQDECKTPVIKHTRAYPKEDDSSILANSTDETYRVNSTSLPRLKLGDRGSPRDMFQDDDEEKIESLRLHDFVFLHRTDGSWTYAIVADRRPDSILFVVDTKGNTKSLSKKRWMNSIRFVNPDATAAPNIRSDNSEGKQGGGKKLAPGQVKEVNESTKICHAN
jgi:hypothetical protein